MDVQTGRSIQAENRLVVARDGNGVNWDAQGYFLRDEVFLVWIMVTATQFCEHTKTTGFYPLKWKILWYMSYLNNIQKGQASIGDLKIYLNVK